MEHFEDDIEKMGCGHYESGSRADIVDGQTTCVECYIRYEGSLARIAAEAEQVEREALMSPYPDLVYFR